MTTQALLADYSYEGHLKKAADIADYYGFTLVPPVAITTDDKSHSEKTGAPEDMIALLRTVREKKLVPVDEPALLAHIIKVPYKKARRFSLHVLGSNVPLAETLLIQVGKSILAEYGNHHTVVHLNSVGGHDSAQQYREALKEYYRGNAHALEIKCQEALKDSVESVHTCTHKGCEPIRQGAPQSIGFLTSASRRHLKNIIERLELLEYPYHLDHSLVGNLNYSTRTVFELRQPEEDGSSTTLARGERYDALSQKIGIDKTIPGVHLSIEIECPSMKETFKERTRRQAPHAFLIQLGFEAKMHALRVSETLRQSKIRIQHHITVDSLSEQLEEAKTRRIPHVIILGQKEVQEGTVIVRNMETLNQDTIPINMLSKYLKKAS